MSLNSKAIQLSADLIGKLDRKRLNRKDFVIISNNCWGAEIYRQFNKPYNTPFVGLFLYGPCYIKLLENFEDYLASDLRFVRTSRYMDHPPHYPLGMLEDLEIHFVHYKDAEEAREKWYRRLNKMITITDQDNYFFKLCDRDGTDESILNRFHRLPHPHKISFGIKPFPSKEHVVIAEHENHVMVPHGFDLYKYTHKYVDIVRWLRTGKIERNLYSRIRQSASNSSITVPAR